MHIALCGSRGLVLLMCASALTLAACGSGDSGDADAGGVDSGGSDGGSITDAGIDADPDGGSVGDAEDGGSDDARDTSGPDAERDAGPDAAADATPTDVAVDVDLDVADGGGDAGTDVEPGENTCTVVSIEPATFALGDEVNLDLAVFCPDGATTDAKTNFAILLSGSAATPCGDEVEEPVEGGTVLRSRHCWPELELTRDMLGRGGLEIQGVTGVAPIVRSIGISQSIRGLVAEGEGPGATIDFSGAGVVGFLSGARDRSGIQYGVFLTDDGRAHFAQANAEGRFADAPLASGSVGDWTNDLRQGVDGTGFMVSVGGVPAGAPLSRVATAGCSTDAGAMTCTLQPIVAGAFEEQPTLVTGGRYQVEQVLGVVPVADADSLAGSWGGLAVLAVTRTGISAPEVSVILVSNDTSPRVTLPLPEDARAAIVDGTALVQLVRGSTTPSEGPESADALELWMHTRNSDGTGQLRAWRFNSAGELVSIANRPWRKAWDDMHVAIVQDAAGQEANVILSSAAGSRTIQYLPRIRGGVAEPIDLLLPDALRQGAGFSDLGVGSGSVQVWGDATTDFNVRATLDVALPDADGTAWLGGVHLNWTMPASLSGVTSIDAELLAFDIPQRGVQGRPEDTTPLAARVLGGSSAPRLAARVAPGYFDPDREPPRWVCEDECLAPVREPLCGNTGHFMTVAVGGLDGEFTWAVTRDDGSWQPLALPADKRWSAPPSGCYVDNLGGTWLAALLEDEGAPGLTTALHVWRVDAAPAGVNEGRTIPLPAAVRDGLLLPSSPAARGGGSAELVWRALDTDVWTASTISFERVRGGVDGGVRVVDLDYVRAGEPRTTTLVDTDVWRPFPMMPGTLSTRSSEGGLSPLAWYWHMDDASFDGGCSITVKGGDVLFSDSASFSVRDSSLLCGNTSHFLVAGDFGDGVGPVGVISPRSGDGAQLALLVQGVGDPEWVRTPVPMWNRLDVASGLLPRVIAADFNGDELTDLWLESLDDSPSGVLFSDGRGGWTNSTPAQIPALQDLQFVAGAGPGLAGRPIYGSEGFRVTSMRRASRNIGE